MAKLTKEQTRVYNWLKKRPGYLKNSATTIYFAIGGSTLSDIRIALSQAKANARKSTESPVRKSSKKVIKRKSKAIDWTKVPDGSWYQCTFKDFKEPVIGRINKNGGTIYLLNSEDSRMDGASAPDRKGFRQSWSISDGSLDGMASNSVSNLIILPRKPKGFKYEPGPIMCAGYEAKIKEGEVHFGCRIVPNEVIRKLAKALKD